MTADTSNVVNAHHDNIIDLVIDSGAATHVCPQWSALKLQLHQLPKKDELQLRTGTNSDQGARVQVCNHEEQEATADRDPLVGKRRTCTDFVCPGAKGRTLLHEAEMMHGTDDNEQYRHASTNDIDTYRCRAISRWGKCGLLVLEYNQGYLVRHHTQYGRSLFMPRDSCPLPQAEQANYRKTIVKQIDKPNEQFIEEAWKRRA